jgi:hypothetical protein
MANLPPKPPQLHAYTEADLLNLRLEGEYTLEATKYVQACTESLIAEYGYYLQLMDVRKAGSMTPDARRWLFANYDATKLAGACAIVGANFAVRTLAQMVIRALNKMNKTPLPIKFVEDEAEGRAWLDQERVRLKREGKSVEVG